MHLRRSDIIIILLLLTIALVRFLFFLPQPRDYSSAIGKAITFNGVVSSPPDIRLANQRIIVETENSSENILVVADKDIEISYGDMVKIDGTLTTPKNFETQSGKEFNYIRYLANQDIYYIVENAKVEIISHGNGSILKSWLFKFRDAFSKNINNAINPPESDLALGLVLGTRGGFDQNMRNEFITTGTIHIVALSGYNITIVAEGVMKVFGLILTQVFSVSLGILFIILFIILSGGGATAIRAGIMASIALIGRLTGRKYEAGRALATALFIMVAYDPRILSDISFQLSFLATFGVLYITPHVMKAMRFLPARFGLREVVSTTLAANIATLPLLLYSTGILSLVSLPANVLILPIIPLAMFLIFITGILSFIPSIIYLPFAYIAHLLLYYILATIHFFATLPFASLNFSSFPLILTLALYLLIGVWVWKKD